MSYKIPRNPAWCSGCIMPKEMSRDGKAPCEFHRGPNGEAVEYTGRDAYDPSNWVLNEVVGKRFTAAGFGIEPLRVYECFGYDPRNGFWVRTVDDEGEPRQANISERAIGATYHRLRMTIGAWHLLEMIVQYGRLPTPEENEASEFKPSLELAFPTLRRNGLVTKDAQLTDRGRELFPRREELYWNLYLD